MMQYLIIAAVLSILALVSLRYCLKIFDKLELLGLLLFCSGIRQQFFYFISSAFKFVDLVTEPIPLTILRINYGVFSPALLVWTLYLIVRTKFLWLKLLYGLIWSVISVALQKYEIALDLLIDNNWTWEHEMIKRFAIVALVYVFMKIWHNALKRDKVVA